MVVADVIFLIAMLLALALGALLGFGKVFVLIMKGKLGYVFVFYFAYVITNLLYGIPSIKAGAVSMIESLTQGNNIFTQILLFIRIDFILLLLIVSLILVIFKIIFSLMVKNVFETDNKVLKIINRVVGSITMFLYAFSLLLVVLQILYLVTWGVEGSYYQTLVGSFFGLDKLFANNPLQAFFIAS